jgi:hypothetical protein
MKNKIVLVAVLSLVVVTAGYGLVQAHGGQSRSGSGGGWFGMGSGHMGGSGWGHMGSGDHMMGSGWNHMGGGYERGSDGSRYDRDDRWRGDRHVTSEEAREIAEHNLGGNPYIKVGKLTERSEGFEVEIVTRKGQELVNRLLVEKETGQVFPIDE